MKTLLLLTGIVALGQAPLLRQGIAVEMAVTTSAVPMREADQAGARVVAVTRSGQLYLEAAPATLATITEEARVAWMRLYVKADSRASYADVAAVLAAIRAGGAGGVNLLTSQRDPADGRDAPPKGIRVSFGAPSDSRDQSVAMDASSPMLFGDAVRILEAARSSGGAVFLR